MSLATNIAELATAIATEVKRVRTWINGNATDLSGLATTNKSNLVGAINEVAASVDGAAGIDDGTVSTTSTWSSQKTRDEIDTAVAGVDVPVLTDLIDDGTPSTSTVYSSAKTDSQIAAAVAAVDLTDLIDDDAPSTSSVYSSTKTAVEISAAVAALVGSSPEALDTIQELAEALGNDPNAITSLTAAVGARVRFDAAQSLTGPQQAQARTNIDAASATEVGDTSTDFVAIFNAGLQP